MSGWLHSLGATLQQRWRLSLTGLSIRSRIYLFQLIVGASVLMIAGVVLMTVNQMAYYLNRVELANHQLEAITALQVNANRFSEQIAEYLLIGEPEREDFESASRELVEGFDTLEFCSSMRSVQAICCRTSAPKC